MAIKTLCASIEGISPLLQNNPQTVDPFNSYAIRKYEITNNRSYKKTNEGILELRSLEIESKVYFDEEIGVYIPSRWIIEALSKKANSVIKSSKEKIRGSVFMTQNRIPLEYDGKETVKTIEDIVKNERFHRLLILPQGASRIPKAAPIFHRWSFAFSLEYDDGVHDFSQLKKLIEHVAKYSGFGDFRPTYGRAIAEVSEC